ncbi:MAG TPA: serine hydrolase domain-containing protein [Chloroflexota bacterium]|nr:serine hydrolase domain-containing protein [Chloroflexota bacterium]
MVLDRTFDLLRRSVDDGLVPGAAAAVGTVDGTLRAEAFGAAQLTPRKRALDVEMLFDCASLTKIVVTTTLALQAIEEGALFLNQKVAALLPEFGAAGKGDVTVRHLLTHTSGLPAWIDLAAAGKTRAGALRAVFEAPLAQPAGTAVVYSDLGFITLGEALSRALNAPLHRLARQRIFEPLAMRGARYRPTESDRKRCVTTEVMKERGGAITGRVHDENCATLGGVAGHAGLFAPLADLERFCRMWLNDGQLDGRRVLSRAAVEAATRDQTQGVDPLARRGLGWVLQPNGFWPAADLASPRTFSHTGFTGTSLVIDPERGLYAVLLTNRVHPTRGGDSADRIRTVRARFHNAAWSELS